MMEIFGDLLVIKPCKMVSLTFQYKFDQQPNTATLGSRLLIISVGEWPNYRPSSLLYTVLLALYKRVCKCDIYDHDNSTFGLLWCIWVHLKLSLPTCKERSRGYLLEITTHQLDFFLSNGDAIMHYTTPQIYPVAFPKILQIDQSNYSICHRSMMVIRVFTMHC